MRGKSPEESAHPATGGPTGRPRKSVSEAQLCVALRAACGRRAREARGAAERGRGQHVLPGFGGVAPSTRPGRDWRIGGWALRESVRKQDRRPTETCTGSIDRTRRRTVGSRPHGRSEDLANMWPGFELSMAGEERVRPGLRSSTRRPNSRDAGANSKGCLCEPESSGATRGLAVRGNSQGARGRRQPLARRGNSPEARAREAQESTDRAIVPWPGWRSLKERTLEGSKASKRACRPPYPASPADSRRGCCKTSPATGDAQCPSDSREPSSRPSSPASPHGSAAARGRRAGERGRENLEPCRAVGWVEREPAWKQEARESGYGSSRRESSEGRLQGRERHETRPRSVGAPR
jgi:hypothetical protein